MDLDPLTTQTMIYGILLTAGVGFVLGLAPLIVGFVKHKKKYGFIGFIASILGGALLGLLLAVPVAAVFTWLIVRVPKTAAPADDA